MARLFCPLVFCVVLFSAGSVALGARTRGVRLDINQKVYIEGQAVLGDGVGQGAFNICTGLAPQFVDSPTAPDVKVCGTSIRCTIFLFGRCGGGIGSQSWDIGACNTALDADTCVHFSADPNYCSADMTDQCGSNSSMGAAQTYKITSC